MQVSENVHRLTQGVTNFYLIEESGKFTVIDAGTPGDWSYFRRSLAALGGSLTDLDAVLLTQAVSVSNGHFGTAVSFDNGFRPALLVSAGVSVLGSVSAILARRARAKAVDLTGAGVGAQEERPRSEPQQPES